jgi:nucleoside-diphosphate-sugar epimerase
MSVGAFPPGRDGSPSYSQHTPANARVQGPRGYLRFPPLVTRSPPIRRELGWTPPFTMEEGLRRTLAKRH